MPLTRFGYETVLSNMVVYLGAAAQSAQLNQNLRETVTSVLRGNPFTVPRQVNRYPAVFIWIGSDSEGWSSIGNQSKDVTTMYNVAGIVQYAGTNQQADQERNFLADNIQALIRNNVNLSNTVVWMTPTRCALSDSPFETGGIHVLGSLIEVEVFRLLRED